MVLLALIHKGWFYLRRYGIKVFLASVGKKAIRQFSLYFFKKKVHRHTVYNAGVLLNLAETWTGGINAMSVLPFAEHIEQIKKNKHCLPQIDQLLVQADHYLVDRFCIFENNFRSWLVNGRIDWHLDIKSNYRWPVDDYQAIRFGHLKGVDIKVPWELSRFHFLITLSWAYLYSREEKYSQKIHDLIMDWIAANPLAKGVNWACTMDVSIRLANWCLAVYPIKDRLFADRDFGQCFVRSLFEHLVFIQKNLENLGSVRHNHYLSNIAGFYLANLLFPLFRQSAGWRNWAVKELEKEIKAQVYADGGNFESSTCYHRLALELFYFPAALSGIFNKNEFSAAYLQRLKKMFAFAAAVLQPNGRNIQLGDNDNGRLFKLYEDEVLDQRYLAGLAVGLFEDDIFSKPDWQNELWSLTWWGKKAIPVPDRKTQPKELSSYYNFFPDSGFYVANTPWFYLAISCLPNGQRGIGGHCHNDKLSMVVNYQGDEVLVDPGSFVYTAYADVRNQYRSTKFHNTVSIAGAEQNQLPSNLFSMGANGTVQMDDLKMNLFNARFMGFSGKPDAVHQRQIEWTEQKLLIMDQVLLENNAHANFHFHPNVTVELRGTEVMLVTAHKYRLKLSFPASAEVLVLDYNYSPAYGQALPAKKIRVAFQGTLNYIFQGL